MRINMLQQHGPWTIVKSTVKYKNPWMTVREDKVIQPDGKKGIYGTVRLDDGASVLPMDNEGFVYLTKEFHYAVGKVTIEVVSGGRQRGETPLATAKRELGEELGITAEHWTHLGVVYPLTSAVHQKDDLFLAQDLSFGSAKPDGTETIVMKKVSFQKALAMVTDGRIIDARTCTLLLKVKEYLKL
jgi:ADP-ribose pyrophosphatase